MKSFFDPEGIAVVGASSRQGKIGYEIVRNALKTKKVYPVNPTTKEILGVPCYPTIAEIPHPVDLAVFALSSDRILETIEECGKKGIKSMVIVSGGFKEAGKEHLQKEMVEKAHKYGIRIIGPNCIGVFNGKNKFNTFFQTHVELPSSGNVAILTQSGTFGIGLLEELAAVSIGISKFVSYGNKADVDEKDMLDYFKGDEETKYIAIYMEGVEDGREFFQKAREIKKPVIILKAGKTFLGAHAASSHTGALATNYEIFRGASQQYGAILADDFEEFLAIIQILAMQPLPEGGNIGIVMNGAGPCVMAADYIHASPYLTLPSLDIDTSFLSLARVSNPIDLTGSATAEDFLTALKELGRNADVDIMLSFFVFQDAPLASSLLILYEGIEEIQKYGKVMVAIAIGGKFTQEQRIMLAHHGIPLLEEPRVAIRALEKIVRYQKWRKRNEDRSS